MNAQIAAVRSAADTITDGGTVGLTISGALVSYVKPSVPDAGTSDPAGFFIQGSASGPALFVALDPAAVTGGPLAVGDLVDLSVETVSKAGGLRQVTALSAVTKSSSGNPVSGLVMPASAADLLAAGELDAWESRLVTLSGSAVTEPAGAGNGYRSVNVATTGTPDAGSNLRLRLPSALMDAQAFGPGCTFTVTGTPMWRYFAQAQPSAFSQGELSNIACPAPAVLGASVASSTSVNVSFSRDLAAASVTAGAFTITGGAGLAVSAAALSGTRTVQLTTGAQADQQAYTVSVASSVTDTRGTPVSSSANSASFTGVAGNVCNPSVVISAVYGAGGNSGATYSYDFVELKNRTPAPVNLAGWTLQYGGTSGVTSVSIALTGTIPANGYFLVRGAIGSTVTTQPLPTSHDQDAPTLSLGGTNGVVMLVNGTASQTVCPAAGAIADFVGYGSASCREGTAVGPLSAVNAAYRAGAGCTDTNANSADFTVSAVGATAPRNAASPASACTCQ